MRKNQKPEPKKEEGQVCDKCAMEALAEAFMNADFSGCEKTCSGCGEQLHPQKCTCPDPSKDKKSKRSRKR